ncbi:MAG: PQQ-like beta-propeller repeat protein [Fimbriimonadaceae bacterium]|jgi:hypothetical protein|nr:PQQ-like beta-propeller repeat protein [Fimbriimonadaceae bacterium]
MKMNQAMGMKWKSLRRMLQPAGFVLLGAALVAVALAQDFRQSGSTANRQGVTQQQPATLVPVTTWANAGRGFLRWWDPIITLGEQVDNDGVGAGATLGTWVNPAPIATPTPNFILAGGYFQTVVATPPYRYARTTAATSTTDPTAGATAIYQWTISSLAPGQQYEVEVNVPIGPTNTQPSLPIGIGNELVYQQRYFVYAIEDADGIENQVIDSFLGGGFVRFGEAENRLYVADATGTIQVRLYNTAPRTDFGTFRDPQANPGNELVYADLVRVNARAVNAGSIQATPVVGLLQSPPPSGGTTSFEQRVVSARNESVVNSETGATQSLGLVTSFSHNGDLADAGQPLRRNMVWSWPVRRPFTLDGTEAEDYATRRLAWLTPRAQQRIQVDNLNAYTNNLGFSILTGGSVGPNYGEALVVSGTPTASYTFGTRLPADRYNLEIHIPTSIPGLQRALGGVIEVLQGTQVVDSIPFNFAANNGWVALPAPSTGTYAHTEAEPLTVRITNRTTVAADVTANRIVAADAVRFVRRSNLSVTSTPVLANVSINVAGVPTQRDVVIVAMNNGRIYCLDAHGDPATGNPPQVYWTYPTEGAIDPNAAVSEDGGIAEMPTEFGTSSGMVVGNTFIIGSANGRVYSIDIAGRGDGTTSRNWTYPNDYSPATPLAQMSPSALETVRGSVSYDASNGNVLIPGNGRVHAVGLAGTPASKSTTATWLFPDITSPILGEISTTPVVNEAGGLAYLTAPESVGAVDHTVYALNLATGVPAWLSDEISAGVPFGTLRSTPLYVQNFGAITDTLYLVGGNGTLTALNGTTGTLLWNSTEAFGGSIAQPTIGFLRTFDEFGVMQNAVPTVFVAGRVGNLYGFFADGTTTTTGSRRNWRYQLEGDNQVSGIAVGGWPNALTPAANRTHLYVGDSEGVLYAFSSVDDSNSAPPITPGRRPGREETADNDPDAGALIIDRDDFILISPAEFRSLQSRALTTTVDYVNDIAPIFASQEITRRDFEFGENLYVLIRNLPTPSATSYTVEVRNFNGGTRGRGGLQAQVRESANPPVASEAGYAFLQLPITSAGAATTLPGQTSVTARLRLLSARGNSGPESRLRASVNTPPVGDINLAHPLGVSFGAGATLSEAGITTTPTATTVRGNNPAGVSAGTIFPNSFWDAGGAAPGSFFSATSGVAADPVNHGGAGDLTLRAVDRSLTTLLFGPTRGITNVRLTPEDQQFQANTNPNTWTTDASDPAFPVSVDPVAGLGIPYALNQGTNKATWLYRRFEDYPYTQPNLSLDYPDISRSALSGTKLEFGQVQNPYFQNVDLLAPAITQAARNTYDTFAGYNAGLTGRTLTPTPMTLSVNVPRFHPFVANAYRGRQFIYVDNGNQQRDENDAFRSFNVATFVAEDRSIATATPTVDLGSMPTGGGYFGSTGADVPNSGTSTFSPYNSGLLSGRGQMFQPFTVLNEGNANLLNVRVAKSFNNNGDSSRNLELFSAGLHELAWIDGAFNMVTSLDPFWAATRRAGFDPQGRMILQKPRSGDVAPTRLSTNPRTRANGNLRVGTELLLSDVATFREGDPLIGVANPIGTPSGSFQRRIFVMEDVPGGNPVSDIPRLNLPGSSFALDPYSDPGILLRFTVREARLTNGATIKAAPNVDNILAALTPGQERFLYANRQPTAMRMVENGNLFVAWTSNRFVPGNAPWAATNRPEGTMADRDTWRIFVAGKPGRNRLTSILSPSSDMSPLSDLSVGNLSGGNNWFSQALSFPYPSQVNFDSLFGVQAGETLTTDERRIRFHSPSFSTAGSISPMVIASSRAGSIGRHYLAFIGEAEKTTASGQVVRVNRLMVATLIPAADGTIALDSIVSMPFDDASTKSRPSLAQNGDTAVITYTSISGGSGTLMTARFDGNWDPLQAMPLGDEFENVGTPSLTVRRYQNSGRPIADLHFTAKLRGRQNAEAFQGRLNLRGDLGVASRRGGSGLIPYTNRRDRLELDAATGIYWAPGVLWSLSPTDQANLVIQRFDRASGNFVTIASQSSGPSPAVFDGTAGEVVFDNTLGGKAYLDVRSGSVKFSGGIIPRNVDLFITYSPTLVKTGIGRGSNYRSVTSVYDERLIGIFQFPNGAPAFRDRDLVQDLNYTYRHDNAPAQIGDLVRHDRFWLAYTKTTADGSSATRPFMKSMRFGVQLPAGVAIQPNGAPVSFEVLGMPAGTFYQIDPVNRRVYFSSEMEDRIVTVRFAAVDAAGTAVPGLVNLNGATVRILDEVREEAVPIEQVGNESDLSLALDPYGSFNNSSLTLRRPPLLWLFWTSTRSGATDVFFQTLAPLTAPLPPNR